MYVLVDEAEVRRYRRECAEVLKKTCEILKKKDISAQFTLVGSGARNLITRNGDGPYDLDYNLEITAAPDGMRNDLRKLKETVRNALNRANGFGFSDARDSTSVLTCLLYFEDEPSVSFKFDVAIVTRQNDGKLLKLVHNKSAGIFGDNGQFTWNEVPNSHNVAKKAQAIKVKNEWPRVRQRYVEKKNRYLCWNDQNHPSFIVYVEAVNEIYYQLFGYWNL